MTLLLSAVYLVSDSLSEPTDQAPVGLERAAIEPVRAHHACGATLTAAARVTWDAPGPLVIDAARP